MKVNLLFLSKGNFMSQTQTKMPVTPCWDWMMQDPIRVLGLGFGTGLAKGAPGTVGSLPAFFISGLFLGLGMSHTYLFLLSLVLFAAGVWICNEMDRELGVHDHKSVVWDEFVAMMMVLACTPPGLGWWLLALLVFRLFDIFKPQPVKWADEKVTGGLGVMLDDGIAGVCTIVVVQALHLFF